MDFALNEEQRLLQDSVERMLAAAYDNGKRQRYAGEPAGFSRKLWSDYAALGLLGLPFEEKHGGIGGGAVETMIVMECFGRTLAIEPYLATVILGGGLVRLGGGDAMRSEILPKITSGEILLAFAHAERQSRYDLADVAMTARQDGADFVLDGEKSLVLNGDSADRLIVSARLSGSRRDSAGLGLFLVDAAADGVTLRGYPSIDGRRAAEIGFSGVRVPPDAVIGSPGNALGLIELITDQAIAALCAEAVGAMDALHKSTVEYLKTRRQFGASIGSFQVLQHRAVDMLIALEQARSMAMFAAMMANDPGPAARRQAISAAKVQIGRSGRFIGQQAIQLHGGIGMTMEYPAGHYFRRLTAIDSQFGDADHHLALLARMETFAAA